MKHRKMIKEDLKIHTEGTPNPNALKFVVNRTLIENGTCNFTNKEKSKNSPLASRLFNINSVTEVFIGKDFITVSKNSETAWDSIYDYLLETINKYFESGEPIILEVRDQRSEVRKGIDPTEDKIKEILDNQIRPAVASDGGDIIFDSYEDGILRLHLQGSCSHCPSSIMTLKAGIEAMLKREIPELKEVISV